MDNDSNDDYKSTQAISTVAAVAGSSDTPNHGLVVPPPKQDAMHLADIGSNIAIGDTIYHHTSSYAPEEHITGYHAPLISSGSTLAQPTASHYASFTVDRLTPDMAGHFTHQIMLSMVNYPVYFMKLALLCLAMRLCLQRKQRRHRGTSHTVHGPPTRDGDYYPISTRISNSVSKKLSLIDIIRFALSKVRHVLAKLSRMSRNAIDVEISSAYSILGSSHSNTPAFSSKDVENLASISDAHNNIQENGSDLNDAHPTTKTHRLIPPASHSVHCLPSSATPLGSGSGLSPPTTSRRETVLTHPHGAQPHRWDYQRIISVSSSHATIAARHQHHHQHDIAMGGGEGIDTSHYRSSCTQTKQINDVWCDLGDNQDDGKGYDHSHSINPTNDVHNDPSANNSHTHTHTHHIPAALHQIDGVAVPPVHLTLTHSICQSHANDQAEFVVERLVSPHFQHHFDYSPSPQSQLSGNDIAYDHHHPPSHPLSHPHSRPFSHIAQDSPLHVYSTTPPKSSGSMPGGALHHHYHHHQHPPSSTLSSPDPLHQSSLPQALLRYHQDGGLLVVGALHSDVHLSYVNDRSSDGGFQTAHPTGAATQMATTLAMQKRLFSAEHTEYHTSVPVSTSSSAGSTPSTLESVLSSLEEDHEEAAHLLLSEFSNGMALYKSMTIGHLHAQVTKQAPVVNGHRDHHHQHHHMLGSVVSARENHAVQDNSRDCPLNDGEHHMQQHQHHHHQHYHNRHHQQHQQQLLASSIVSFKELYNTTGFTSFKKELQQRDTAALHHGESDGDVGGGGCGTRHFTGTFPDAHSPLFHKASTPLTSELAVKMHTMSIPSNTRMKHPNQLGSHDPQPAKLSSLDQQDLFSAGPPSQAVSPQQIQQQMEEQSMSKDEDDDDDDDTYAHNIAVSQQYHHQSMAGYHSLFNNPASLNKSFEVLNHNTFRLFDQRRRSSIDITTQGKAYFNQLEAVSPPAQQASGQHQHQHQQQPVQNPHYAQSGFRSKAVDVPPLIRERSLSTSSPAPLHNNRNARDTDYGGHGHNHSNEQAPHQQSQYQAHGDPAATATVLPTTTTTTTDTTLTSPPSDDYARTSKVLKSRNEALSSLKLLTQHRQRQALMKLTANTANTTTQSNDANTTDVINSTTTSVAHGTDTSHRSSPQSMQTSSKWSPGTRKSILKQHSHFILNDLVQELSGLFYAIQIEDSKRLRASTTSYGGGTLLHSPDITSNFPWLDEDDMRHCFAFLETLHRPSGGSPNPLGHDHPSQSPPIYNGHRSSSDTVGDEDDRHSLTEPRHSEAHGVSSPLLQEGPPTPYIDGVTNNYLSVVGELGRGISALVLRALITNTRHIVALKSLFALSRDVRRQLRNELGVLIYNKSSKTTRCTIPTCGKQHPKLVNIVQMIAQFYDDGWVTIVLEFMNRGDLQGISNNLHQAHREAAALVHTHTHPAEEVSASQQAESSQQDGGQHQPITGDPPQITPRRPVFDEITLQYLAANILLAITSLHLSHLVHRDIKPQNILVNANGDVKLSDFGLCTVREDLRLNTTLVLPRQRYVTQRSSQINTGFDEGYVSPHVLPNTPHMQHSSASDHHHPLLSETSEKQLPSSDSTKNKTDVTFTKKLHSESIHGTIQYLAPERLLFNQIFLESDVFSFGLTLLALIHGTLAVPSEYWQVLAYYNSNPDTLQVLGIDPALQSYYSADLQSFLECCLVANPVCRWSSLYLLLFHPFMKNCQWLQRYFHNHPQHYRRLLEHTHGGDVPIQEYSTNDLTALHFCFELLSERVHWLKHHPTTPHITHAWGGDEQQQQQQQQSLQSDLNDTSTAVLPIEPVEPATLKDELDRLKQHLYTYQYLAQDQHQHQDHLFASGSHGVHPMKTACDQRNDHHLVHPKHLAQLSIAQYAQEYVQRRRRYFIDNSIPFIASHATTTTITTGTVTALQSTPTTLCTILQDQIPSIETMFLIAQEFAEYFNLYTAFHRKRTTADSAHDPVDRFSVDTTFACEEQLRDIVAEYESASKNPFSLIPASGHSTQGSNLSRAGGTDGTGGTGSTAAVGDIASLQGPHVYPSISSAHLVSSQHTQSPQQPPQQPPQQSQHFSSHLVANTPLSSLSMFSRLTSSSSEQSTLASTSGSMDFSLTKLMNKEIQFVDALSPNMELIPSHGPAAAFARQAASPVLLSPYHSTAGQGHPFHQGKPRLNRVEVIYLLHCCLQMGLRWDAFKDMIQVILSVEIDDMSHLFTLAK